ncbi:MAG: GNAT family N-acetyltransferase [Ruminococcaceae bacterium]|nr:GNAT family N-acetyltransferase [Oscillospiraceae bacterium]HHV31562.1 GNAT family N-acetyltransferase [Clostridiales bacterium]
MTELRQITLDNFEECIRLEPKKEQSGFVASNLRSLAEAYVALTTKDCIPLPYAIYQNGTMVGFLMLAYNEPNETRTEPQYWVCRLMIDQRFQGRGFGKAAMQKALELLRTFPCGKASHVFISYEPENFIANALYASLGFTETGEVDDDGELVARLPLL